MPTLPLAGIYWKPHTKPEPPVRNLSELNCAESCRRGQPRQPAFVLDEYRRDCLVNCLKLHTMLRTMLRHCFTALSPAGAPTSRAAAHISARALWVRNFGEASQSTIQASQTNFSVRKTLPSHAFRPRQSVLRAARRDFHHTSKLRDPKTAPKGSDGKNANANEPQGLSARLKKLSREYGWSAVGVYLAMSILDFPFCFLLVRIVGTDRIGNTSQRQQSERAVHANDDSRRRSRALRRFECEESDTRKREDMVAGLPTVYEKRGARTLWQRRDQ